MVEAPSVPDTAHALGLHPAPGGGIGCPACGAALRDARRGAVGFRPDGRGWRCHRCDEAGDGLALASWVLLGRPKSALESADWRALFTELAALGLVPAARWRPGAAAARPVRPPAPPPPPAPPLRPPGAEVRALWDASLPLRSCLPGGVCPDPQAAAFIAARGLLPLLHVIDGLDLARLTPPAGDTTWPGWWPAGRAARWRLLVQAVESDGQPASLHARAVVGAGADAPPPEPVAAGGADRDLGAGPAGAAAGANRAAPPKTLWPRACGDRHFAASGLFFANPAARALLRGEAVAPPGLLLCEGLTDWLAAAAHAGAGGWAVLGGVSGSWSALAQISLPVGLPIVVAMDPDAAGARYHAQIAAALPGRRLATLRPNVGARPAGGTHA